MSVNSFEKDKVNQQSVDNKIVYPQAVKEQDGGKYRNKYDPHADDFRERSVLLYHPRKVCHYRRAKGEHRPTDDKRPTVDPMSEHSHCIICKQHPQAKRKYVQHGGFLCRAVNGNQRTQ